jgi:hypothetical protein
LNFPKSIRFNSLFQNTKMHFVSEVLEPMLAEKFFLVLETLRSHASDHNPQVATSTTRHVPATLPRKKEAGG